MTTSGFARAPSRLDAWLAWQAEIGTPEVVLPEPWVGSTRPDATTAKTPDDPAAREEAPVSRRLSSKPLTVAPPAPEDFFRDIERKLAEPIRKPGSAKPSPRVSPAVSLPPSAVPDDFESYWTWLEAEYPRWFPSLSAPLVRAEGVRPKSRLAVVELHPTEGVLFGGEAGALLDKMMGAIGLSREALYLTSVMKASPSGKAWARKDVARALPAFLHELELSGCRMALLLGEACAQAVLRTGKSLAALDDFVEATGKAGAQGAATIGCIAAWHPAELLRDAALKAPTWERLKALKSRLEGNPS